MSHISELEKWDIQDHLKTPTDCALFIQAAMLEAGDDPAYFTMVLREVARSRGMAQTARDAGITREGLYKALGENSTPSFETITKVLRAFGLKLSVEPIGAPA